MPRVQTRALIERSVWDAGAFFPRIEYLRFDDPEHTSEEPWTRSRAEAHIFPDYMLADELARRLSTPEMHVFPAIVETATTIAQTIPAQHRRRNEIPALPSRHDWREDVPNAGVE